MLNPPYKVWLRLDGSNANSDIDIGDYDLLADILSGNCLITDTISANTIICDNLINDDYYPSSLGKSLQQFSSNSINLYHPSGFGNFNYISSQNYSGVRSNNVKLQSLNDNYYLLDLNSQAWTCFVLSGAHITPGDAPAPTGSINIGKGQISIRAINNDFSTLWFGTIENTTMNVGSGYYYVNIDYNSGSPIYTVSPTSTQNGNTIFRIGRVYNDFVSGRYPETHCIDAGYRGDNLQRKTHNRFRDVYGMEREYGLVVASSQVTGHPLAINITAGATWRGINRFETTKRDTGEYHPITAVNQTLNYFVASGCDCLQDRGNKFKVDSSTGNDAVYIVSSTSYPSGTELYKRFYTFRDIPSAVVDGQLHDELFDYYYRDGAGGWNVISGQTSLNVTNYDDGDGTLGTLGTSKYGIQWVYVDSEGHPIILFGQGSYNIADARLATTPASVPVLLSEFGILISRIITQKSITDLTTAEFAVPWTTKFTAGSVTLHSDLGGLNGDTPYYHLGTTDYTNLTTTILDNGDASTLHHHDQLYPGSSNVYLENIKRSWVFI